MITDLLELLKTPVHIPTETTGDNSTEDAKHSAPMVEPPKRWRNKWEVVRICRDITTGKFLVPNGPEWGPDHPSKEVAETIAKYELSTPGYLAYEGSIRWLGAFPVEE